MKQRTDADRVAGGQAVMAIVRCLMGLSDVEAMVVLATVTATQIVRLGLPAEADKAALDLHAEGVRGKMIDARAILAGLI